MRRIGTLICALSVLTAVLPFEDASAAYLGLRHHARHHHHYRQRVARVDLEPGDYSTCRWGWWQSLRYGHVQPYWGARCP